MSILIMKETSLLGLDKTRVKCFVINILLERASLRQQVLYVFDCGVEYVEHLLCFLHFFLRLFTSITFSKTEESATCYNFFYKNTVFELRLNVLKKKSKWGSNWVLMFLALFSYLFLNTEIYIKFSQIVLTYFHSRQYKLITFRNQVVDNRLKGLKDTFRTIRTFSTFRTFLT